VSFKWFLAGVFTLFVGILVFIYVQATEADPVMLDERGRVIEQGGPGR
jgi:hypothetical protein